MSGAKSILEIDLKDDKWQAFQEQFGKYSEALRAMPGAWSTIGSSIHTAEDSLEEMARLARISATFMMQMAEGQERMFQALSASQPPAERLERTTKSVSRNILDATASLVRWSGLIGGAGALLGGLLGGGTLWGLERLGSGAGAMRRGALGLGVSPGEQQAFGINYGRFVDPGHTLESVADAQTDLTKRWAFGAMGVNPEGQDAAGLASQLVRRAKALFDKNPTQQGADAYGLTQFFSMDELRRLHGSSQEEVDEAGRNYGRDRSGLAVDPRVLRGWQDFTQQMQRAGQTIENTFITGLVPLERPLADLSRSFTDVVSAFLKAPEIKELIGDATAGLENFAHYLGSPQFKEDVDSFEAGFKRMVGWLHGVNTPWNDSKNAPIDPKGEDAHPTKLGRFLYHNFDRLRGADEWLTKTKNWLNVTGAHALETWDAAKAGLPDGFAQKIFKQEAGLNPDGSARISGAGAIGAGQLMPGTARVLGVNPYDASQNISGSVHYMSLLLKHYGNDQAKAAAAYNWGIGNVDKDIAAHGDQWAKFLPAETTKYIAAFGDTLATPKPIDPKAAAIAFLKAHPMDETAGSHGMSKKDWDKMSFDGKTSAWDWANKTLKRVNAGPVKVEIHNNTGGSAVVSASQAAAG